LGGRTWSEADLSQVSPDRGSLAGRSFPYYGSALKRTPSKLVLTLDKAAKMSINGGVTIGADWDPTEAGNS
jgi:hypothetical protein